jgi:glycine/D-amino acid oxidase-like deaminating enzyme
MPQDIRMASKCEVDCIVVGGGVLGSAVSFALAESGLHTLLIERGRVGSGATGWSGGVVRCFHEDQVDTARAIEGWHFYSQFRARVGEDVTFVRTGYLYFPKVRDAQPMRSRVACHSGSPPMSWLSAQEVRRLWPELRIDAAEGAVFESEAGYMDPLAVSRAMVRAAVKRGAKVWEGVEVNKVISNDGKVSAVETANGTVYAPTVVVAAGYRCPAFLSALGISHDLWTQMIQVDLLVESRPLPPVPAFVDDENDVYGRHEPLSGGLYAGRPTGHRSSEAIGTEPLCPHAAEIATARLQRRYGWAIGTNRAGGLRHSDCYCPGGHGRIGPVAGGPQGLLLATGFNGGGFKMAPWVACEIKKSIQAQ